MATNKNATIRYHALDRCFSNPYRKFFIEDLIEACNEALYDFTGIEEGVKRRQILYDISFMESEQGWSVPLDRIPNGKRVYYRYSDKDFSIRKQAVNSHEAQKIAETLQILNRFKGMPQFEWMDEILVRLESSFHLKGSEMAIVEFEQNPYLKGLELFADLFGYIRNKSVLEITYQGFKQNTPQAYTIHPYFLKQYNNRWFLFGLNDENRLIQNLPLDRIKSIQLIKKEYIENSIVDFNEYFEDVIGVTVLQDEKPQIIKLFIEKDRWPYIKSKPLHGSQKTKSENDDGALIEMELIVNNELIALLFSYGEDLRVLEPDSLKQKMIEKANSLLKNYES